LARTSLTHPLRIDDLPFGRGRLGITFCPGKSGRSVHGAAWRRDLDIDLDAIRDWGARAVLTLIEDHEFGLLAVPSLGQAVRARGMDWHHFPTRDVDVPTPEAMALWRDLSPRLHDLMAGGGNLLVHCRGGLGRAGTIAALLLIESGRSVRDAIAAVRAVRPGAIETAAQEHWVIARAAERGAS
jgi:ADP-ribosyl-[dinitrogen reductase] hydrolase